MPALGYDVFNASSIGKRTFREYSHRSPPVQLEAVWFDSNRVGPKSDESGRSNITGSSYSGAGAGAGAGGAIYAINLRISLIGAKVLSNQAASTGGAVHLSSGTAALLVDGRRHGRSPHCYKRQLCPTRGADHLFTQSR